MESNSVCNHMSDLKKIGHLRRGSPICLIVSMITNLSTLDISPPANVLKKDDLL